jgi:hypothetical protein
VKQIQPLAPSLLPMRARSFGTKVPQDDATGEGWLRIEPLPNLGRLYSDFPESASVQTVRIFQV